MRLGKGCCKRTNRNIIRKKNWNKRINSSLLPNNIYSRFQRRSREIDREGGVLGRRAGERDRDREREGVLLEYFRRGGVRDLESRIENKNIRK